MKKAVIKSVEDLLKIKEKGLLEVWMKAQLANIILDEDIMTEEDLREDSISFLHQFVKAVSTGNLEDITADEYVPIIKMLQKISRKRANAGFSPSEIATFVFSLKDSILEFLQKEFTGEAEKFNLEAIRISKLLDKLVLITFEEFNKGREDVLKEQQKSIMELSSPIVTLWNKIIAIPIIGILDSKRTQMIMENLLKTIVEKEIKICIIDITGVAVMDTEVSAHLVKTGDAITLLGAEAVLTGVRPEVAQTIVHLGVDFSSLKTRATMADGLAYAFNRLNIKIEKR